MFSSFRRPSIFAAAIRRNRRIIPIMKKMSGFLVRGASESKSTAKAINIMRMPNDPQVNFQSRIRFIAGRVVRFQG